MAAKHLFRIQGREVLLSNLEKVFYPGTGFSKADVIDYYVRIAPVLLPHLKSRAITLKRYPDGVGGEFFYEKQCPSHAPPWIKTTAVKRGDGTTIRYCLLGDLPSLVWAANLANLELHPFQHKATAPSRPTTLVFDLDPGPPADLVACCQVAIWLRDLLDSLRLECLPKTSGSKGLQLVVPLNTAVGYKQTKAFARMVAEALESRFPDTVVSAMARRLRKGKVFIDWSQNDDKKTTVSVYSLRAREAPLVSTPVTWEEVSTALRRRNPSALSLGPQDVLKRVDRDGDRFAQALTLKQKLPR